MIDFKSLFSRKKGQAATGAAATGAAAAGGGGEAPSKGGGGIPTKDGSAAPVKESKFGKRLQGLARFDLKGPFTRKKQFVGLDIGSNSLKLVEILGSPGAYTVNRFLMVPLARGVVIEGTVMNVELLAETIRYLFQNSGCEKKEIVASLSGHSVIVKKAPFPRMEAKDLREAIRDEAGKYLPFDNMDEVNFDFQVLGPAAENPNLDEVIIVAAKREVMDGYVEAIELAGLSLAIMDVDSFALETMYMENYDYEENDVVVIANIGAGITNLNVLRNATSIFTRDFAMGGNMITEAIESQFGVGYEEAEKIKIYGPEGDEYGKSEFFRNTLMYLADPLCGEIERSIDYFRSTFSDEDIKMILLAGGGANIPGIANNLAQRMSVPVEIINPFRKIAYNRKFLDDDYVKEIAPIAAVGVGLALRKLGDK